MTVTATDSNSGTVSDDFDIVVSAAPNAAPTASNGTVTTNEDTAHTFAAANFNFADTDSGDSLSSVKIVTLPAGGQGTLTLNTANVSATAAVTKAQLDSGHFKYTPPANANGTGYASFTFKVNDGTVDSSSAYTLTINVTAVNDAPTVATAIPDQTATAGTAFRYQVPDTTFSDADTGDMLSYAATQADGTNLPTWLGFTAGTRTFAGTPAATDVETVSVTVTATDSNSGTVSDDFDIVVSAAPNAAPTVANEIPDQTATADAAFSYQFPANTFNDTDTGDTLSYMATKTDDMTLPTWLTFTAGTRTFTGMPASTDTGTVSVKVTATDSSNGAISDGFDILVVPALTVSFEDFNNSDLVEGNSLDVPVLLSGAPGREVTITLFADPSRGLSGSDYTTSSLGLTFGASETRKVVTVTATDDSEVDPGERLVLALPAAADLPTGILLPSSGDIKIIQIADNDFQYQASHAGGTTLAVNEQAGTLTATVRVEAPNVSEIDLGTLNENVVLSVSTADGTATAGQDYTLLSQTLTFAPSDFASQDSGCPPPSPDFCTRADKTVTVTITDDTAYEGATAETFTLTLSHDTDQRVTYPSPAGETATVSIADDERPALTFTVAPTTILENAGTATVTLATTDGTGITADTAIALSLAGTATKGTDYTISSESLTLTAGQSSVTATITATMDSTSDDNETVVVTASSGGTAIGTAQTVTITETLPALSIAVDPASIAEAAGTSTVTVSTGTPFTADQTIALTLGGTATVTSDYTLSDTSLTLTAGETSVTATVTAVQDTIDEPNETVIVSASNGGTAIGSATVTITDDDAPGTIGAPELLTTNGATVSGDTLTLTYDELLDEGSMPLPSAYTVTVTVGTTTTTPAVTAVSVRGSRVTATVGTTTTTPAVTAVSVRGSRVTATVGTTTTTPAVTAVSVRGSRVILTLTAAPAETDVVTLIYTVPTGTGAMPVQDVAGNPALGFIVEVTRRNPLPPPPPPNTPPVVAIPLVDQEATTGDLFTYVVPADAFTDADGDRLTYAAALSGGGMLPSWLVFDPDTRTFTGTPASSDSGTVRVTVTARDRTATVSDEFTLTVTVRNTAPVVAIPLADQEVTVDVPFTYVVPADAFTDADGDLLTYTAALSGGGMLPSWLVFDPDTRTFTGTPASSDSGPVFVTVTASDGTATVSDEFALRVLMVAPSTLRAWTSRFGRTVATHVTDAVGERLRPSPEQDSQVTVGGYRLPLGRQAAGGADPETTTDSETTTEPKTATDPETATDRLASLLTGLVGRALGLGPAHPQGGGTGTDPWAEQPAADPRLGQSQTLQLPTVRLRDVLLGSSFRLTLGDDAAAPGHMRLTAWGRVAGTQFSGRDGALTLDGDVLTGTVGVDSAWDRWLAGVAVSHSLGGGSFTGDGDGDLDSSTLTSIHPYLRYAVNERVDVWSVLGYGWGDMTLEPGTGGTLETDTTLLMGAFGGRGILLSAPDNAGFQLATRTDAMLTRTTSGAVAGLAETEADAHRLRLVLEGSRPVLWPEGQSVTPAVEIGLRHDWGDAETGFGLELGGRVRYADPGHGLTIEAAVRGLLAHEDSDYGEWGASGTIRIDPGPMGQGLSLTLAPTWGAVVERDRKPLVPADRRGPGSPRHPVGPNRPPERRSQLWCRRALRHRPPDPLCGHGAHGWRGPHLPGGHAAGTDRGLDPGRDAEPGRAAAGAGRLTVNQPGPAIPSRLGVLSLSSPDRIFSCCRGRL